MRLWHYAKNQFKRFVYHQTLIHYIVFRANVKSGELAVRASVLHMSDCLNAM